MHTDRTVTDYKIPLNKSILEKYFKKGSISRDYLRLNSTMKFEKIRNNHYAENDYIERQKQIPGTGISLKEKKI